MADTTAKTVTTTIPRLLPGQGIEMSALDTSDLASALSNIRLSQLQAQSDSAFGQFIVGAEQQKVSANVSSLLNSDSSTVEVASNQTTPTTESTAAAVATAINMQTLFELNKSEQSSVIDEKNRLRNSQLLNCVLPDQVRPQLVSGTKKWQLCVALDTRNYFVSKLLQSILPLGPPDDNIRSESIDTRMYNCIMLAEKEENNKYQMANSLQEYYQLMNREIRKNLKKLGEKRRKLEEEQQQQQHYKRKWTVGDSFGDNDKRRRRRPAPYQQKPCAPPNVEVVISPGSKTVETKPILSNLLAWINSERHPQ